MDQKEEVKKPIIHIMIIGSKYKNEQETKNALVDELIKSGFIVHIDSHDVISEAKANLGYDKESVLNMMKVNLARMSDGSHMSIQQNGLPENEIIFRSDNCTLRRVATDASEADENFYKKEFDKNKDASYHFLIDGIGYEPESFTKATRFIKLIQQFGHDNITHIDWCTCCAEPKIIPSALSRRNSNEFDPIKIDEKDSSEKYDYKLDAYDLKNSSKELRQKLCSGDYSDDVMKYLMKKKEYYCNNIPPNTTKLLIDNMSEYLKKSELKR